MRFDSIHDAPTSARLSRVSERQCLKRLAPQILADSLLQPDRHDNETKLLQTQTPKLLVEFQLGVAITRTINFPAALLASRCRHCYSSWSDKSRNFPILVFITLICIMKINKLKMRYDKYTANVKTNSRKQIRQ